MANELIAAAFLLWLAAAALALIGWATIARALLAAGGLLAIAAAFVALPAGTDAVILPTTLAGEAVGFRLAPDALWLMGFGLVPAILACALSTTGQGQRGWLLGASASLIGALGVFGLQNGTAFLVAWEVMSLGGAVMLLGERLVQRPGRPVLFMLALLEVGAVALLVAFLLLGAKTGSFAFAGFPAAGAALPEPVRVIVWLLLIAGFGAKLGLLPFYEWFPGAYGSGSGATGALMSGVVLNAAFFALGRTLSEWMPTGTPGLGIFLVLFAVLSAILTALYAFQQEDWRALLSFSSAENAAIAVTALGAALLFRADGAPVLSGLAWTVALLHLAGHALAKGGLFLAADGVFRATGSYAVVQGSVLRRSFWPFGVGALFAAASLAAMPPQAGFVSEWYVFQTVFQGFHLTTLGARLTLAIAGAGLALTAAVAFATFVKVFGLGLLGRAASRVPPVPGGIVAAVATLGLAVLALAVGMPHWLGSLDQAVAGRFGADTVRNMQVGLVLVPGTGAPIDPAKTFAFISPSLLVVVMPLLALIPVIFLVLSRGFAHRRSAVWYGGLDHDPDRASTTALTFSNALRTFYGFIYRPQVHTARETNGQRYFIRRLVFTHDVAPVFGRSLFRPTVALVLFLAERLRALQSGNLNFYLALIGLLLVVILGLSLT
ncbi:MAG TPA: proton-conducting transporter membrane subunit [Hyphomicrobiales bacterium]|nr:proton-conducting transporter membrane subunit [Hyphomicrobiales bacterium]